MKVATIRFIAGITLFVLLGILFTQFYWIRHAVELREEQFNNRVRIALKTVVNHLFNIQNARYSLIQDSCQRHCLLSDERIKQIISPIKLDSLIQNELGCMRINRDYEYAVFNRHTHEFLMGSYANYEKELLNTGFNVSLSCLHQSDDYALALYFPHLKSVMVKKMISWVVLTAVMMLVLFILSFYTLYGLFRQKRLSEIKNDFVNNMTHEFKTPISTVSLASEMLLRPEVINNSAKVSKYARLIYDENLRLKNQVENVLQIAILDKGEFAIKQKKVNVHHILEKLIYNFELRMKERNGRIIYTPSASNDEIYADKVHLANIFINLLDNAEKYSPESPIIHVDTRNNEHGIIVSIKDNGIGISKENQQQVFRKLYRVPTGNLHDVKGFGLGLYYVKTMVEAHNGSVKLQSELKKGSCFEVLLPFSGSTSV